MNCRKIRTHFVSFSSLHLSLNYTCKRLRSLRNEKPILKRNNSDPQNNGTLVNCTSCAHQFVYSIVLSKQEKRVLSRRYKTISIVALGAIRGSDVTVCRAKRNVSQLCNVAVQ